MTRGGLFASPSVCVVLTLSPCVILSQQSDLRISLRAGSTKDPQSVRALPHVLLAMTGKCDEIKLLP